LVRFVFHFISLCFIDLYLYSITTSVMIQVVVVFLPTKNYNLAMSLSDLERDEGYDEAFLKYGESPKSLQWYTYRSQALRFRQLVADVEIGGKKILDVGCGLGDLLPFLYAKSDNFRYLGLDISEDFIEVAKKRYEGHEFRTCDPFSQKVKGSFDVVLLSGVLNIKVPNWLEERKQRIKKLYQLANEVAVFNMSGGFKPIPEEPPVVYADTSEILDFCRTLAPKVILRAHYLTKDFTIDMFH
jgi:SAM-dependent methyltransferase